MSITVKSNTSDVKRDFRVAYGNAIFYPEWPPVTVSTLSIKDKKAISFFFSFSFASSKDLRKEISSSSMIFDFRMCIVLLLSRPADVNYFAALLERPRKISSLPQRNLPWS